MKQLETQLKQQQQQQSETSEKIIIAGKAPHNLILSLVHFDATEDFLLDIDPEQEASERVSELEQRVKQLEEELSKAKRTNLNKVKKNTLSCTSSSFFFSNAAILSLFSLFPERKC